MAFAAFSVSVVCQHSQSRDYGLDHLRGLRRFKIALVAFVALGCGVQRVEDEGEVGSVVCAHIFRKDLLEEA